VAAVVVHLQGFQWGCCYPPTNSKNIHEDWVGLCQLRYGQVTHFDLWSKTASPIFLKGFENGSDRN